MLHNQIKQVWLLVQKSFAVAALGVVLMIVSQAASTKASLTEPLEVVASFSILGDMAREIGGEYVNVTTIVGPNADVHTFEPSPKAVQALAQAGVVIENGLGFETWLPRLIESADFNGIHVVASKGITPRKLDDGHDDHGEPDDHSEPDDHGGHGHQGGIDPHAWQNLKNGMIYAQNIAQGLALADPGHASYYQRRVKAYVAQMKKLDDEVVAALEAIPAAHRKVITGHDAFGYFGAAYGIKFIALAGLSNDAEPSARDMAELVDFARQQERVGIVTEMPVNPKLIQQLARETGLAVGGPLYSDSLGNPDEPAGTYLGMFHWNVGQLITLLGSKKPLFELNAVMQLDGTDAGQ